jgi:RNA polymerase sigma-32 factor
MSTDSTALSFYRGAVARRPPLTPSVERDLAERYKGGERAAAGRLVEGCLSTVVAVAWEYRRCGPPLEDLVQEGNLGLLKAVERFDPGRGVRLAKYAAYWIRAEIREYVARQYRIVRPGSSKGERRVLWLYRRTREQAPEALAAMSGISTERVTALLPLLMSCDVSLSAQPGEDGPSLVDRLSDGAGSAEDALCDVDQRDQIRAALATLLAELPARDQDIVRRRLLAEDPATLEQLGATWGVTRERVRQLEEKVKERIRGRLEPSREKVSSASNQPAAPRRRRGNIAMPATTSAPR